MTTDTPLLPCPFCGGAPVMLQQGNDQTAKRRVTIKCTTCRAERTDAALRNNMAWLTENAVANWNTRPTLERDLSECRAALRKMLDLFDGKLRCADHETDRECLNRVTAETLSAARAILAKGDGE